MHAAAVLCSRALKVLFILDRTISIVVAIVEQPESNENARFAETLAKNDDIALWPNGDTRLLHDQDILFAYVWYNAKEGKKNNVLSLKKFVPGAETSEKCGIFVSFQGNMPRVCFIKNCLEKTRNFSNESSYKNTLFRVLYLRQAVLCSLFFSDAFTKLAWWILKLDFLENEGLVWIYILFDSVVLG